MKRADIIFPAAFLAATLLLVLPQTHDYIMLLAQKNRYLTGFIAFALLGPLQELLSRRLAGGNYPSSLYLAATVFMWGCQGLILALAFWVVNGGVIMAQAAGILPGGGFGDFSHPLKSFFTGFFFTGPFFTSIFISLGVIHPLLAAHRLAGTALELFLKKKQRPGLQEVSDAADWPGFIKGEALRIALFRIPFLTFVFMLPSSLWLLGAAWAGVLLGALSGVLLRR